MTYRLPQVRQSVLLVSLLAAISTSAQAATFYQKTTSTTNWAVVTDFSSTPDGTGPAPGAIAGNDFFVNGKTMGSPSGAATYPGNSLTVDNLSTLLLRNGGLKTVPTLITSGSALISANSSGTSLSSTNFTASAGSTTTFQDGQGVTAAASTLMLGFGTLNGSGNFVLSAAAGVNPGGSKTIQFTVTTGTNFTGNISWGSNAPSLQFGNDLTLGGGLIATDALSRITLDHNVTLASASFNGTSLTPGTTYSFAQLNAAYDTIFNDGGSGSITISAAVPEPATALTTFVFCGLLLFGFRERLLKRKQS